MTMRKDLIREIEELLPTFSKGQKTIANYLLHNYDKAAYLTAARLGKEVGVSESTVVRFAIELGFDGYPGLQQNLREIIRTRLTTKQRMVVTNTRIGNGDILNSVLESDIDNIRRTLDEIDHDAFNEAVHKIIHAKSIYIIGMRSSGSLASFLAHYFRLMFDDVRLVQTTSGSEMFEHIFRIGKDDVMVAISFPRYSARLVNAVAYAKEQSCNIISITDGQIFLETELFHSGVMPAINPGISVSRVGGAAQIKAMKSVSGTLKLVYSQYRELQSFAQFGSDLDANTKATLAQGERIVEVLKQHNSSPVEVIHQVAILYAVTKGFLKEVPVEKISEYEAFLYETLDARYAGLLAAIRTAGKLEKETEQQLASAIAETVSAFLAAL